jgi:glutaconyl-CoA decarboxylase
MHMKRFQVTVNGKVYDVGVTELAEAAAAPAASAQAAATPAPAPASVAQAAPAASVQAAATPAPAPASVAQAAPVASVQAAATPAPAAASAAQAAPVASVQPAAAPAAALVNAKEVISAPMPGKILSVKVSAGQPVKSGDLILILEAMKMENEIFCGEDGTIHAIHAKEGDSVNPGDVLVAIH